MTDAKVLLTKAELAEMLNVSMRTLDRLRARGIDLGEIKLTPTSYPRFNPDRITEQVFEGRFKRKKINHKKLHTVIQ